MSRSSAGLYLEILGNVQEMLGLAWTCPNFLESVQISQDFTRVPRLFFAIIPILAIPRKFPRNFLEFLPFPHDFLDISQVISHYQGNSSKSQEISQEFPRIFQNFLGIPRISNSRNYNFQEKPRKFKNCQKRHRISIQFPRIFGVFSRNHYTLPRLSWLRPRISPNPRNILGKSTFFQEM